MNKRSNSNSRKTQEKFRVHNNIVYYANTHLGWSIVIMPENVLIDNYHTDKAHIHPSAEKHYEKIFLEEKILKTVLLHLDINNGLKLELLKEELYDNNID